MRVGIIGLGLMGGSLALALREARPELELVGSDSDPATLREALRRGMEALSERAIAPQGGDRTRLRSSAIEGAFDVQFDASGTI